MDAVVIASATQSDATRNRATGLVAMTIEEVLKGGEHVKINEKVKVQYYGKVSIGGRFLLSGVSAGTMQWSCQPLNDRKEQYVKNVMRLATESPATRLKFYYTYLQDDEKMMSLDAYDEFAIAPYDVLRELQSFIQHDDLVSWLRKPELPTNRKRLYLTMLGVVGSEKDLTMLEEMLRSKRKSTRGGLDALIACYLTLAGESGLPLINELFLANKRASYPDTYAAIMAIRFHGTEGNVIARSALVESLHLILQRPDLVDLVIPDLARWQDWSQVDRVVELFTQSDVNNNFIRAPIINYLRACPLPTAKVAIDKIKEQDPEGYRRANMYFAIPMPSYQKEPDSPKDDDSKREDSEKPEGAEGTKESRETDNPEDSPKQEDAAANDAALNPWRLGYVLTLAIGTFTIAPFLLLTGGSPPTNK